ncbi:MAG: LPXTG cell wall anchor domain-containing protein [Acidimicrobiia bacterium]
MSIRHRVGTWVVLTGIAGAGIGVTAGPAYGSRGGPRPDDCVAHLTSAYDEGIDLATSPGDGSEVAPGSTVTVTSRWDGDDWEELNKILLCVTSDGTFTAALSGEEKPADNDGEIVWAMTVPAAASEGTELCVRSVVFGNAIGGPDVQRSKFSCLRVASAVPTTTAPAPTVESEVKVTVAAPPDPAPEPAVLSAPELPVDAEPEPLTELPRTGAGTGSLVLGAGASILVGALGLIAGRRKSPKTAA